MREIQRIARFEIALDHGPNRSLSYTEWLASDRSLRARELYDHQADPHESRNIAMLASHRETVASLHATMHRDLSLEGATLPLQGASPSQGTAPLQAAAPSQAATPLQGASLSQGAAAPQGATPPQGTATPPQVTTKEGK